MLAILKIIAISTIYIIFTGCSIFKNASPVPKNQDSAPINKIDVSSINHITPKYEPKSRIGNPKNYKVFGQKYNVMSSSENFTQTGIASWYGVKFHGRNTSNGDAYDMYELTAAHKSLPLPTYVEVTNLENNKSLIVRVNDRGPFHDNRIIDLSYAAAAKLGVLAKGTAKVFIKAINLNKNLQDPIIDKPIYTAKNNLTQTIQAGAFGSIENALRYKNYITDIFNNQKINHQTITMKNINNLYKVHIENIAENSLDKITSTLALNNITYSVLTK